MIRTTVGLMAWLAVLFLAATAAADQYPSQQRGLSANAYQIGDVDAVNLFNLNAVVRIPLGNIAYPVGPELDYSFQAVFNSTLWDYEETECVWQEQVWPYAVPVPNPRATTFGWFITFGKIFAPHHEPFNDTDDWIYLSPDGGQHRLHQELHPGHPAPGEQPFTWFSRDSTFLRLRRFSHASGVCAAPPPNAVTGSDCYRLEFPNGIIHEFHGFPVASDSDWRLTRMRDRHGNNYVDLRYPSSNEWQLIDSEGRTQRVFVNGGRVTRLELTAFDNTTATINFYYTSTVIERQQFWPPNCATENSHVTVDLRELLCHGI